MEYVKQLQQDVRQALVMAKGYERVHLATIQKELDAAAGRLTKNFTATLNYDNKKAWALGGSGVASGLGVTLGLKLPVLPDSLLVAAQSFTAELIKDLSKELVDNISSEIRIGIVRGENPYETMSRISDTLFSEDGGGAFNRAETIVRTENSRIFGIANQERLSQAAKILPKMKKIWLDADLPNERESHAQAALDYAPGGDPGPIPVDEPFIVGGFPVMFPGDPGGDPGEVINCRCASAPYMEDWENDAVEARSTETQESRVTEYGTASSGNRGHAGRPGEVGGSAPEGGELAGNKRGVVNFSKTIQGASLEKSGAFDKGGKLLLYKEGGTRSIEYSKEDINKMRNAEIHVHNHPVGDEPFSPDDITFAGVINAKELVVVTEHMRFSVAPITGKAWPADPGYWQAGKGQINYKYMIGLQGIWNSSKKDLYNFQITSAAHKSEKEGRAEYERIARQLWKENAPKLGLIYREENF